MTKKLDQKELDYVNQAIAEDLRLIAEKYKDKDPSFASYTMEVHDLYLAKTKEK